MIKWSNLISQRESTWYKFILYTVFHSLEEMDEPLPPPEGEGTGGGGGGGAPGIAGGGGGGGGTPGGPKEGAPGTPGPDTPAGDCCKMSSSSLLVRSLKSWLPIRSCDFEAA